MGALWYADGTCTSAVKGKTLAKKPFSLAACAVDLQQDTPVTNPGESRGGFYFMESAIAALWIIKVLFPY